MDPVKSEVQDAIVNEELFQFEPEIKGSIIGWMTILLNLFLMNY